MAISLYKGATRVADVLAQSPVTRDPSGLVGQCTFKLGVIDPDPFMNPRNPFELRGHGGPALEVVMIRFNFGTREDTTGVFQFDARAPGARGL